MTKLDFTKLMKVFDNICRNKQYVQHYKGARIISYNDPENEQLILQIQHKVNDNTFCYSFIVEKEYYHFDIRKLSDIYRLTLRDSLYNELNELIKYRT